jgi:DNA polymerase III alpha subunit
MTKTEFGEFVYHESDIIDAIMAGRDLSTLTDLLLDDQVDLSSLQEIIHTETSVKTWKTYHARSETLEQFDTRNQSNWHMPLHYKDLDIAAHVLSLCHDETELQRAAQELLMYQERGLFDLLRYLVYLVDVMKSHNIVWGVGRGSSVASFVLYLLQVHRVNSITYDLDPAQFLR